MKMLENAALKMVRKINDEILDFLRNFGK